MRVKIQYKNLNDDTELSYRNGTLEIDTPHAVCLLNLAKALSDLAAVIEWHPSDVTIQCD